MVGFSEIRLPFRTRLLVIRLLVEESYICGTVAGSSAPNAARTAASGWARVSRAARRATDVLKDEIPGESNSESAREEHGDLEVGTPSHAIQSNRESVVGETRCFLSGEPDFP